MQKLLRLSELIDGLNERVGRSLSWLVLIMVILGVYNAVTRKLSQTIGMDLSSNMYIEAQWYMFSIVFLWGGAYTLKHRGHVRVDILYSRVKLKVKAWIDILGTVLFLMPLS
ncbi:MAG: TRAP transporter small permease subunit, partial [Candidatus Sedimenticola sp. 6PFRAG5]